MNILYISKYVVLPEFGAPTRQYFLSKYLAQIPENNVLLVGSQSTLGNVPCIEGLYKMHEEGNLETVTLRGPKINLGFNVKRLLSWVVFEVKLFRFRKNIKLFKPDIVIISSLSLLTFIYGIFLKKWLHIPLVLEVRDIYPLTLIEVGGYSKKHPAVILLGLIEKWGYKNADLIISTLPNAKEHISSKLKKTINFQWLPMGVDLDYYSQKVNNKQVEFIKDDNCFYIGYAGTLGKANALDVLFESATSLNNSHPKIKFVIIGEGPLKPNFIEKYGQLNNLIFLPPVKKNELQLILRQMDVLINTWLNRPIYNFGISPNKWIDYMMASKPLLVAFNGYDNIIHEANCGIITSAEDSGKLIEAILEMYSWPQEKLNTIGENGNNYLINKLDYKILANKLNAILVNVINNNK